MRDRAQDCLSASACSAEEVAEHCLRPEWHALP